LDSGSSRDNVTDDHSVESHCGIDGLAAGVREPWLDPTRDIFHLLSLAFKATYRFLHQTKHQLLVANHTRAININKRENASITYMVKFPGRHQLAMAPIESE
jgi:hypothetical protein